LISFITMSIHKDNNHKDDNTQPRPVSYSIRAVGNRIIERQRKKRGRKPKYSGESKAKETYNPQDTAHKMREIMRVSIENNNCIYSFEKVLLKYGGILRGFFPNVDFNNEAERLALSKSYDMAKRQFLKDQKRKREATGGKYKAINDKINNDDLKKHIIENLSPEAITLDPSGLFLFDLSKLTEDAGDMYAFIKTDLKDKKTTQDITEITNYLTFKQLELDHKEMTIKRAELILKQHEILTDLEGNTLDRMTKYRAKKVIKSADSLLNNLNSTDYTQSEKQQIRKKQELLDLFKTGRDISKKRNQ
jgi:hypothetical protein